MNEHTRHKWSKVRRQRSPEAAARIAAMKTEYTRLRVLDISTPWFWFVIFVRRSYGEPLVQASLYSGRASLKRKWWCIVWQREELPDTSAYRLGADLNV